jgi:hypothetical protein
VHVLGHAPEVDVMAKLPQGLLNASSVPRFQMMHHHLR